jgi:spermidine synthase
MALVRESVEKFDLIFLDLTDPVGPAEALYTQSFYADCKRSLATGGALVLHIGSPFSHASRVRKSLETLRATFSEVEPWFVHIPAYGATWGFAMASDTLNPRRLTAAKVDEILHEKKIGDRQFYNGDMHTAMLAQPEYIKAVIS